MTRLTLHTTDSAPEGSRPLVARAVAANGYLPNLIGVLANAPVALETYLTVSEINGRASLSLAEREAVQITAARIHGCEFCVAGHSAIGVKKPGWTKPRWSRCSTASRRASRGWMRWWLLPMRSLHRVARSPRMRWRFSALPASASSRCWRWCWA